MSVQDSAKYIAFFDLDDFLIPESDTTSWADFYEHRFAQAPATAAFIYLQLSMEAYLRGSSKARWTSSSANSPREFSIAWIADRRRPLDVVPWGKWVAKVSAVDHGWIHWPTKTARGLKQEVVPVRRHYSMHMRRLYFVSSRRLFQFQVQNATTAANVSTFHVPHSSRKIKPEVGSTKCNPSERTCRQLGTPSALQTGRRAVPETAEWASRSPKSLQRLAKSNVRPRRLLSRRAAHGERSGLRTLPRRCPA